MAKDAKKKQLVNVDESVKIPAAVLAAAAKADEIHGTAYKAPEPPADPPADPAVVVPEVAASTPAPAPAPEPVPAPIPAPQPAPPAEPVDWEHRFNSMKGRWEREQNTTRALTERLTGMEATIAAMQVAPAPAAPVAPVTPFITPQEEVDYGKDFLDVVGRKAKEQISPELDTVKQELDNLKKRIGNVGEYIVEDARSRMHKVLDEKVPNWKVLNDNEKFLDWLALPDTYSGAIRHNLLRAAHAANDTPRVLAFFQGFLSEEAASIPPAPAPGLPAVPPAKVPLESLAAPGRAKTAAAHQVPAEKPFFTRAQISQFYVDSAAGKYRGREDEKRQIEQQIHAAGVEGRIR